MPLSKEQRYTAEEFFELIPETTERHELIDGEIVDQAAPGAAHQRAVLGLGSRLSRFIQDNKGSCEVFIAPFDVKLDDHNVVQPDVLVVCDPDKVDEKRCNGAPDFIIEVVSSNRSNDYNKKLALYKEAGVREYWIVDLSRSRVLVYFFDESDSPNIFTFDQPIPVGIYGGALSLTVAELV